MPESFVSNPLFGCLYLLRGDFCKGVSPIFEEKSEGKVFYLVAAFLTIRFFDFYNLASSFSALLSLEKIMSFIKRVLHESLPKESKREYHSIIYAR